MIFTRTKEKTRLRNNMSTFCHISLVVLSLYALVGLSGCDGHTTVSGTIVDSSGKPINAAEVSLMLDDEVIGDPDTTNEAGGFFVGGVHSPGHSPLSLVIDADGYQSVEKEFKRNKIHKGVRVTISKVHLNQGVREDDVP